MIRPVQYNEIFGAENAAELLAEYSAECSIPEIGETNPQASIYAHMEASGMMKTFGAYIHGELAGFASILIYTLPHYGKRVATVESIFVARKHRRSGLGKELMRKIEHHAKDQGCVVILYSAPSRSRLEALLMSSKPYRWTNSVFTRVL